RPQQQRHHDHHLILLSVAVAVAQDGMPARALALPRPSPRATPPRWRNGPPPAGSPPKFTGAASPRASPSRCWSLYTGTRVALGVPLGGEGGGRRSSSSTTTSHRRARARDNGTPTSSLSRGEISGGTRRIQPPNFPGDNSARALGAISAVCDSPA